MSYFYLIVCFLAVLCGDYAWASNAYWLEYALTSKQKNRLKRKEVISLKTSLIIPCYYKHAAHLYPLLRMYEQQTRLPDQVVISLSEVHRVTPGILEKISNEQWAFPITLIVSEQQMTAGQNRNMACEYAIGDLFITQDADDIVHPQRIEIIHYFFTHYNIDHLMHRYAMIEPKSSTSPFHKYTNFEAIKVAWERDLKYKLQFGPLTNGNVAVPRYVWNAIKWPEVPRGEDVSFNRKVHNNFEHCIAIHASIYGRRKFLSSESKIEANFQNIKIQSMIARPWPKKHKVRVVPHSVGS